MFSYYLLPRRYSRAQSRSMLWAGVFLVLAISPVSGQKTDVIALRNGNTITGEIKSVARGKLEYSTDDMGTMSVKWDKVLRIRSFDFFQVELRNGDRLFGTLPAADEDGKMVVFLADQDTIELRNVVLITPIQTTFWDRTSGYIDFGFNLTRADEQREISLSAQFKYRGRKLGATVTGNSYLRFQNQERSTSRSSAGLTGERFLPRAASLLLPVNLEQNEELDLALRTTVGVGAGRYFIRNNRLLLQGAVTLAGQREQFTGADSAVISLEAQLVSNFEVFRFDSPKLDFTLAPQLFVSLTQLGRFRTDIQLRSSYEVFKDFFFGLTAFYKGDTDPPSAGAAKDDYGANLTIGWSWS